jgi:predicted ATP-grasp superfamily ATP-dependent carboligase
LKILLLEYITAGGMSCKQLPASLLREAKRMRDALLADLSDISGIEIVTSYDARLSLAADGLLAPSAQVVCIDSGTDAMSIWRQLLANCDAALLIAPETDQRLSQLSNMLADSGVKNLGCSPLAVDIASNKYDTCRLLQSANILTIPTYSVSEFLQPDLQHNLPAPSAYIVKPIDGAGCAATLYFNDVASVNAHLNRVADQVYQSTTSAQSTPSKQIVQPYQAGTAASIAMLCKQGQAWLLSFNQQNIIINHDDSPASIGYHGGQINALNHHQQALTQLANSIAAAMPGLNGYVGVDVIIQDAHIYVVEINPRITTSYIGLRESLGCNPLQLILDLNLATDATAAAPSDFSLPAAMRNKPVEISLDA